ncbi:MAG: efflux RND transporter periplasmic adaptor subunit [Deltaproteobacteria bacterium]|nr:efflux RND transporter periplasmic adaptor subunit [Deltaproteobacteria bacterium]
MKMEEKEKKLLRFLWGSFPWFVVLLLCLLVVTMWFMNQEKKIRLEEARKAAIKEAVPAVRVITLTLEPTRLADKLDLPAEVKSFENLWVKTEVSGQVVRVPVKEGQTIEKGQILVELDDRDYRLRLERIQANHKLATLDHERVAELARKKITAETELDKIEAQLKDLSAQLKEAQLALSRTKIMAPISGRLNEIEAKIGDWLAVDKPVVQILQLDVVKINVGVPESDVPAVLDLTEADVIIEALGNRKVMGTKIFLSRQPSTYARLYDLELIVQNPDGRILPGMFARVELVKEVFNEALVIPIYAVMTQGDERFVYVLEDNKAKKRHVDLGILTGWQIHVTSGLKPGEQVIVDGHRLLDDGQSVEVIRNVRDAGEIIGS